MTKNNNILACSGYDRKEIINNTIISGVIRINICLPGNKIL
ncbi:MAG: hypothetical protein ACYTFY_01385 [Planctomycetota bacterium]